MTSCKDITFVLQRITEDDSLKEINSSSNFEKILLDNLPKLIGRDKSKMDECISIFENCSDLFRALFLQQLWLALYVGFIQSFNELAEVLNKHDFILKHELLRAISIPKIANWISDYKKLLLLTNHMPNDLKINLDIPNANEFSVFP